MQVTEVRVKLMGRKSDRLKAFCSITLDGDFVVRDVKVIEGTNGLFVAMPSRRLADRCPMCRNKNSLRSKFCSECGARLDESRAPRDTQGRLKLHVDIAHPINAACRQAIEKAVLSAFEDESSRAQEPGYMPQRLYDEGEDAIEEAVAGATEVPKPEPEETPAEEQNQETKNDADTDEHRFGQGIL